MRQTKAGQHLRSAPASAPLLKPAGLHFANRGPAPAKHLVAAVKTLGAKASANGVAHHKNGYALNLGAEGAR